MSIVSITNDQNIPMTLLTTKEYMELKDKEIRKNILEQKYAEMLLNIEKYVEEIKTLKEEKQLLENSISELRKQVQELIDKNNDLTEQNKNLNSRVENLENDNKTLKKDKENNDQLVKMSQCIYNYKATLKSQILKTDNSRDYFEVWDLFDILLKGDGDDELTNEELMEKNAINDMLNLTYGTGRNKKNGSQNLKRHFRDITRERNFASHPIISEKEKVVLKGVFIEYCNNMFPTRHILNKNVANDVFGFSKV